MGVSAKRISDKAIKRLEPQVFVAGTGWTKFGELWGESVESLAKQATEEALEEAKLRIDEIDLLIVGNMLIGQLEKRGHVGRLVGDAIGFDGPAVAVEAACASGGVAVRQGVMALMSGMAKKVLVVGVEKMTDVDTATITRALMAAGGEDEQIAGATFPALYALMHRAYQAKYKITDKQMAEIPVKAHYQAMANPLAQFRKAITVEQVLKSALVADPIRILHCSPISDGAAALVLSTEDTSSNNQETNVKIVGSGQGGDSLSLSKRENLTSIMATKRALFYALREAQFQISNLKFKIEDVSVAEVHDCFSVAQLMAVRDLGVEGALINPSGGLKACGHPVGATGVKQVVAVARYLREHGGYGLTQNVGGTGATAVVHILSARAIKRKSEKKDKGKI